MYKKSLFIFRRDFRLDDNIGLMHALKQSKKVVPIFIFTAEQVVKNSYKSEKCVQFMIESLKDLDRQLRTKRSRLFYFFGKPEAIVSKLITSEMIEAVFVNTDYTKYAATRDKKIEAACRKHAVDFHSFEDITLNPLEKVLKKDGKPFLKFTPFFLQAKRIKKQHPKKLRRANFVSARTKISRQFTKNPETFYKKTKNPLVSGGRAFGLKQLKVLKKNKTTLLAPYLKFGCLSIREAFCKGKARKDFARQLLWRDFYYTVSQYFPHIYSGALQKKYNKLKWSKNAAHFTKWKEGKTGFPVVDACMRNLNATGHITNRARLIVSNFLVKTLLISWRKGEKYFAQTLIDYDPAINNGNWQWVASTSPCSQAYFRVLNPWIQSKSFDPRGTYIKQWVPELTNVPAKEIHNWYKTHQAYSSIKYPKPIVDYQTQKQKALAMYKKLFKS